MAAQQSVYKSSALVCLGSQDSDALQYVKIGNSRADRFVVFGERLESWSVRAGITLMEMTVIRPPIFMIGFLRLNKQIRCGIRDHLVTRDQKAISALVSEHDAAGHSETLNGYILPAIIATEPVDFVETLAALF